MSGQNPVISYIEFPQDENKPQPKDGIRVRSITKNHIFLGYSPSGQEIWLYSPEMGLRRKDFDQKKSRKVPKTTIIAISKTKGEQDILDAVNSNILHFGENRVQEALNKFSSDSKIFLKFLF